MPKQIRTGLQGGGAGPDGMVKFNDQYVKRLYIEMRNLYVHDYENVDLEIVWNTLLEDIPALKISLEVLLG